MDNNVSSLCFRSNVYSVVGNCEEDRVFQSKIHDPFSLEKLKKISQLTEIQNQEYQHASLHCSYAYADDYPWGSIINEAGNEIVVCRCINTECYHFNSCRPDFELDELVVLEDNKDVNVAIFDFDDKLTKLVKKELLDEKNAAKLYENCHIVTESVNKPELSAKVEESVFYDPFVLHSTNYQSEILTSDTEVMDFQAFTESSQDIIIKAEPIERSIINAGPGTGKTWTIIEKIIYMINNMQVDAENILVLCFSRAAVEVVKTRLSAVAESGQIDCKCQCVDVRTFDSFATCMLAWIQDNQPELLPKFFLLEANDFDTRIRLAADVMKNKHDILADYEHIFVDEVQDLVGSRAELVLEMLKGLPSTCGFTILGDSCQSLYDYLTVGDPYIMSSAKFYHEVFKCFPASNYYSLMVNHRQDVELADFIIPYRKSILCGTKQERDEASNKIIKGIKEFPLSLCEFNRRDACKYIEKGTLGILTRTNGQALQISSWLRNNDIPHALQRSIGTPMFGDWISLLFCEYDNCTVDELSFINSHLALFPMIDRCIAQKRWMALVNTQTGSMNNRYEVEDLLSGIMRNAREPILYESNGERKYAITVSSIHRAKGKEFDSVILIDDQFEASEQTDEEDILEHKVRYVALTRAKKKIERASIINQYIYITKNETRRCFKASLGRKKYISHFEVGSVNDLDIISFAQDQIVQQNIQCLLQPGIRLKLIKCPKNWESYVVYRVVIEDEEQCILGYTSKLFFYELERAMQRILGISYSVFYEIFPHAFCDVYVDDIITCISGIQPAPAAAKMYGEVYIWTGFTMIGFAAVDKDTY